MIELSIEFDKDKYKDMIARAVHFNKNVNLAIARAAKRAAEAGRAEAKRQLSSSTTLPSSDIGKTIEAKPLKEGGQMRIFSSVQDLLDFKGVKRSGADVSVEILKGKKHIVGNTFIGVVGKTQKNPALYKRDEATGALKRFHGPTTVGMFKANENVHEPVIDKIMETLDKRMIHELERILGDSSARANLNG